MNLHRKLLRRAEEKRPIRVGLIGAGKFGTMFLAQARLTPGIQILGVADLNVGRARDAFQRAGWPAEQVAASSLAAALKSGGTHITDDAMALISADGLDVVVEATGVPQAGIKHALAAIAHKRARDHGLCRGGCAGGSAPGQESPGGGCRVLPGLR